MKTSEEIKRGLEGCGGLDGDCENCPYDEQTIYCNDRLMRDALAYIQRLEAGIDHAEKVARECAKSITENLDKLQAKLIQVERERDAAVADLSNSCAYCKHTSCSVDEPLCTECFHPKNNIIFAPITRTKFEWRGVCPENTKVKHIPENCHNYTIRAYDGMGCCLGTKEIDPCKSENCENWEPKEE